MTCLLGFPLNQPSKRGSPQNNKPLWLRVCCSFFLGFKATPLQISARDPEQSTALLPVDAALFLSNIGGVQFQVPQNGRVGFPLNQPQEPKVGGFPSTKATVPHSFFIASSSERATNSDSICGKLGIWELFLGNSQKQVMLKTPCVR